MKSLIEFIVKSIVEKPNKVRIKEEEKDGLLEYLIQLDPEDIKTVIGKKGETIYAIRNLIKIKAIKLGKKINIKVQEN